MQHQSSPWRVSRQREVEYPQYSLQHTMSMLNLNSNETVERWQDNRVASPTASSVASSTSRSTTPTTSSSSSKNPWSNVMTSPSSTASTRSTGSSPNNSPNRTPQYTSRSTTPVAPQPIRPINPVAGFVPMSPAPPATESLRNPEYPAFPGSPNPYRQVTTSFPPLVNGFINSAFLSQGQSLSGWFYEMARKQGWEAPTMKKVWQWTLSNPRIALLLVICDDVRAWRDVAWFNVMDEHLPLSEERIQGLVSDPRRVLDEQWRATAKELPLNGSHVEFGQRETVPLQHINLLRNSRNPEKSTDRVRMLGNSDDRVLVRKRFIITRPAQKASLLKQINEFKRHDHKNIAKLLCSYSQQSHIGIITAKAQYTLDDYLSHCGADANRLKLLLDWMQDLAQALDYLHSQSVTVDGRVQSICHRSIRPRKILIDGSRIYLAPFGIGSSNDTFTPTVSSPQRLDQVHSYFSDQSYIYAAPEAIVSKGKRPADVFSLGCVFLCMITVVQNHSLPFFTQYRAGSSQDASFHQHLDRVGSWRSRLHATVNSGLRMGIIGPGRKQRQLKLESDWLQIIQRMIFAEPKERIKISKVVSVLARLGDGTVSGGRRRSLDEGGFSGKTAAALGAATGTGTPNGIKVNGITPAGDTKPELSVFDGYFQQQERRGW